MRTARHEHYPFHPVDRISSTRPEWLVGHLVALSVTKKLWLPGFVHPSSKNGMPSKQAAMTQLK